MKCLKLAISPSMIIIIGKLEILFSQGKILIQYVHLVAESDYLEDLKHGWDFALRHFIEEYKKSLKQQQNIQRNRNGPRITYIDPTLSSQETIVKNRTSNDKYQYRKTLRRSLLPIDDNTTYKMPLL